jgi:hypothetical protein
MSEEFDAETRAAKVEPTASPSQPETGARAVLRDAIQKVMKEIEHHESEAQRHLQTAATLRKELRESIAFLRKQGEPKEPPAVSNPAAAAEPGQQAAKDQAKTKRSRKRRRGKGRKKEAARKAQEE